MCEFQAKLIAFLDRELPSEEVAGVERHIEGCEECRNRLAGYELVNETFDAYCDAVMAAKTRRPIPHWVPVLASAAVAAVVMFLVFPEKRMEPPPVPSSDDYRSFCSWSNACSGATKGARSTQEDAQAARGSRRPGASREMAANGDCRANCHSSRSDVSTGRHAEGIEFRRGAEHCSRWIGQAGSSAAVSSLSQKKENHHHETRIASCSRSRILRFRTGKGECDLSDHRSRGRRCFGRVRQSVCSCTGCTVSPRSRTNPFRLADGNRLVQTRHEPLRAIAGPHKTGYGSAANRELSAANAPIRFSSMTRSRRLPHSEPVGRQSAENAGFLRLRGIRAGGAT